MTNKIKEEPTAKVNIIVKDDIVDMTLRVPKKWLLIFSALLVLFGNPELRETIKPLIDLLK
jgi:hypothetical protein